jgi:hypothetical protein
MHEEAIVVDDVLPRSVGAKGWLGMAEISEKTRLGMTIGGAAVLIVSIFAMGNLWGGWQAERLAQAKTLDRHEGEITDIRRSVEELKETIILGQADQRAALDAATRADGKATAILLEMATLRESLVASGVNIPRRGGSP